MRVTKAHIAGVGITASGGISLSEDAITAGTKALLDAGITYSDVDLSIACFLDTGSRIIRSTFDVFGKGIAPVSEVDNHSAIFTATQCIKSGQKHCIFVIGIDQADFGNSGHASVVAFVLVSHLFLTSHAYLKDSSVCIRACTLADTRRIRHSHASKAGVQAALRQAQLKGDELDVVQAQRSAQFAAQQALGSLHGQRPPQAADALQPLSGSTGFSGICGLVWQLRGWTKSQTEPRVRNCLQYTSSSDGSACVVILSRSDGRSARVWSEIENLRDGRERLGYNPALEARGISEEDLQAVIAKEAMLSALDSKRPQLPIKGGDRSSLARL